MYDMWKMLLRHLSKKFTPRYLAVLHLKFLATFWSSTLFAIPILAFVKEVEPDLYDTIITFLQDWISAIFIFYLFTATYTVYSVRTNYLFKFLIGFWVFSLVFLLSMALIKHWDSLIYLDISCSLYAHSPPIFCFYFFMSFISVWFLDANIHFKIQMVFAIITMSAIIILSFLHDNDPEIYWILVDLLWQNIELIIFFYSIVILHLIFYIFYT